MITLSLLLVTVPRIQLLSVCELKSFKEGTNSIDIMKQYYYEL